MHFIIGFLSALLSLQPPLYPHRHHETMLLKSPSTPLLQHTQSQAQSKHARLMASAPASALDCSNLLDAQLLMEVIRNAVSKHAGCVFVCVCSRAHAIFECNHSMLKLPFQLLQLL